MPFGKTETNPIPFGDDVWLRGIRVTAPWTESRLARAVFITPLQHVNHSSVSAFIKSLTLLVAR